MSELWVYVGREQKAYICGYESKAGTPILVVEAEFYRLSKIKAMFITENDSVTYLCFVQHLIVSLA